MIILFYTYLSFTSSLCQYGKYLDFNETLGEQKLERNYTRIPRSFEHILEAAPHVNSSCMATYLPSEKPSK